jgi:hypothetical protein
LSSVKLLICACLLVLAQRSFAEGVPFAETSAPVAGSSESQAGLISELKYHAVQNWLKTYLGARFPQFEKQVTKEFSERYVLDYKVGRSATNHAQIELSGHLDADGLKAWIRVADTKARGNATVSPFLVLSSTAPGISLNVADTATRIKDSTVGSSLFALYNESLRRFNIRVGSLDLSRVVIRTPPTTESDINQLREQAASSSANTALWLSLSACKTCGGFHLDTYFYSLTSGKLLLAHADDITLAAGDVANSAKVKAAFKAAASQFATEFDTLIGSGVLQSTSYSLSVEGIDSYRAYKALDAALDNLDYVTQSSLKAARSKNAVYEVLSPLGAEELAQRIGQQPFSGFTLKPVRVDSRTLVVRYSIQK